MASSAQPSYVLAPLLSLTLLVLLLAASPRQAHSQPVTTAVLGYAWSDTIGWVDLNCANSGTCATNNFGLSYDNSNGQLSGYAWSDNVGWISANSADLSGCPTAPCTATLSQSGLSGWLKVLSANDTQSGGWDGWIRLGGSGYGVTLSGSAFSGYAWGDTNIGWLDFSNAALQQTCVASNAYTCSANNVVQTSTSTSCAVTVTDPYAVCDAPAFCSPGVAVCLYPQPSFSGHLQARPSIVLKGKTTKIYWDVANVSSCTVTGTNGDTWSGATSGNPGKTSAPINQQTIFTLSCSALDSSTYQDSITVNLVPAYQETRCPVGYHVHSNVCVTD